MGMRNRSAQTAVIGGRMNTQTEAVSRTNPTGNLYPAYNRGGATVGGSAVIGVGGLFDVGSPSFWRFVLLGAALAYVAGYHVTIGGRRLIGVAR